MDLATNQTDFWRIVVQVVGTVLQHGIHPLSWVETRLVYLRKESSQSVVDQILDAGVVTAATDLHTSLRELFTKVVGPTAKAFEMSKFHKVAIVWLHEVVCGGRQSADKFSVPGECVRWQLVRVYDQQLDLSPVFATKNLPVSGVVQSEEKRGRPADQVAVTSDRWKFPVEVAIEHLDGILSGQLEEVLVKTSRRQ